MMDTIELEVIEHSGGEQILELLCMLMPVVYLI